MKQVSDTLAARLAASDTTLCNCWRFTRQDGQVFGATDHDARLVFDGVTFEPVAGLELVSFESNGGLAPGRATADGALSFDFLNAADLDAGIWDGARVDVWRVDWRAVEHRLMIWSGFLSELSRAGAGFTAELVSLKAGLERTIGRVYSRRCDADVGDARCGVDLAVAEYRADGVISHVSGERTVRSEALNDFQAGWFTGGRLQWTSGGNAGLAVRIVRHAGDELVVIGVMRVVALAGDGFVATAGCNKAFGTCREKFSNAARFRGFPHMPGPEAVLAGPASGAANDGGRRG